MHNDAFYAAVAVALPVLLLAYIAEARARITDQTSRINTESAELWAALLEDPELIASHKRAVSAESEPPDDEHWDELDGALKVLQDLAETAFKGILDETVIALAVLISASTGLAVALAALLFGSAGWQGWLLATVCVVCTLVTLAGTCWMLLETLIAAAKRTGPSARAAQLSRHGTNH